MHAYIHTHAREGPGSMNGVNCILRWNRPTNLFSLSFTTGHRRVASKYRRCLCIFADRLSLLQIFPLSSPIILLIIPADRGIMQSARYFQCDIYLENLNYSSKNTKLWFRIWMENLFETKNETNLFKISIFWRFFLRIFFFFLFITKEATKFRVSCNLKLRIITKL